MIDFQFSKVTRVPKDLLGECFISEENSTPFEWRGILFKPIYQNGNKLSVKKFEADIDGIRLSMRGNELTVSNSLHKFQKRNNYSDFTHSELVESIDKLSNILGVNSNLFKLSKLEIGVNIETQYVDKVLQNKSHYKLHRLHSLFWFRKFRLTIRLFLRESTQIFL